MSFVFSDTTNYKGLVQMYEKEVGFEYGDVSGNTKKLKQFTADVNAAMDEFIEIALKSSGEWQYDDSNHDDYPIIKTNLVSGQRDYTFLTDQDGNMILDIFKVMILPTATSTTYYEIQPIDQQNRDQFSSIDQELTTGGSPWRYDKTANGIFLDPQPNYNATNGLKIYINREGSYFTYTDTVKTPGVPGTLHSYFYKRPAQQYAARKLLSSQGGRLRNGAYTGLAGEVKEIEAKIAAHFGRRNRDQEKNITSKRIAFR